MSLLVLVSLYEKGLCNERHLFHKEANAEKCYRDLAEKNNMVPPDETRESFGAFQDLVERYNEVGPRELKFEYIMPEDLSNRENKVPELVRLTEEYRGVGFAACCHKEKKEFHKYIDKIIAGVPKMNKLYRHRGWFYFTVSTGAKLHIKHGMAYHTCNTFDEMHRYIDSINNA